jgi:hypothetical protein
VCAGCWEAATKININGERVTLDLNGPLGQAQWAKTRYGIATHTLPSGYWGLPLQRSCPPANACLSCPVCSGRNSGPVRNNGRKRHVLVNTLGLLIVVLVTAANVQDRDGGRRVLDPFQTRS